MLIWAFISGMILLGYIYVGYPFFLWILSLFRSKPTCTNDKDLPSVAVVISVYNEEDCIYRRIKNLIESAYPADRLTVLIGSDGSTDSTNKILSNLQYPNVECVISSERRGKAAVLNELINKSSAEILVFSDANTLYEPHSIQALVSRFADPGVGGVCGELMLRSSTEHRHGFVERMYWGYESGIKQWEGEIGSTIAATGAVYAVRRSVVRTLPTHTVVTDDLMQSLNVIDRGSRFVYESRAVAYETPAPTIRDEARRRVRIGAGNSACLREYAHLLRPKYGLVALSFLSHKVLRWFIPFILILLVILALLITIGIGGELALIGLWSIVLFWLLAGWVMDVRHITSGIMGVPFYFIAVNVGLGWGLMKGMFGHVEPTWSRVQRSDDSEFEEENS